MFWSLVSSGAVGVYEVVFSFILLPILVQSTFSNIYFCFSYNLWLYLLLWFLVLLLWFLVLTLLVKVSEIVYWWLSISVLSSCFLVFLYIFFGIFFFLCLLYHSFQPLFLSKIMINNHFAEWFLDNSIYFVCSLSVVKWLVLISYFPQCEIPDLLRMHIVLWHIWCNTIVNINHNIFWHLH